MDNEIGHYSAFSGTGDGFNYLHNFKNIKELIFTSNYPKTDFWRATGQVHFSPVGHTFITLKMLKMKISSNIILTIRILILIILFSLIFGS